MKLQFTIVISIIVLMAVGCRGEDISTNSSQNSNSQLSTNEPLVTETTTPKLVEVDFSSYNNVFNFKSNIPSSWKVENIPATDSINIYDPAHQADNSLDQSQIFIRHFKANSFLTLTTVDVISREEVVIKGRKAIRYEIEKKPGIANFTGQPLWRSSKHKLVDIRYADRSPSEFYVFSYNPLLSAEVFEKFISELEFGN